MFRCSKKELRKTEWDQKTIKNITEKISMIKEVGRENKAKLFKINLSLNTPWKNILINKF